MRRDDIGNASEAGDIIIGGLMRIVAVLLVVGVLLYEVGAVVVNEVQLDDIAGTAVRAGASTPRQQRNEATVERAVLATIEGSGARLETFVVSRDAVTVTISRDARVLVLDRLGPLGDLAESKRTKQAAFR